MANETIGMNVDPSKLSTFVKLPPINYAFKIRTENAGDTDVILEVFKNDTYGLCGMKLNGFNPRTIVDVGAHIGCFSALAHCLWPDARIVCFEPNERSFELLKLNVPFARTYNMAVRGDGAGRLFDGEGATGGCIVSAEDVPGYTLSGTVHSGMREFNSEAKNGIDLLKLDCEGSEWDIIPRIESPGQIKRVVGEWHGRSLSMFGDVIHAAFPHLQFAGTDNGGIGNFSAI